MKNSLLLVCVSCLLYAVLPSDLQASPPVVSNVSASQQAATKLVDIYYDVSASTATLTIAVQVSADGGASYTIPAATFSGAIGAGVAPGVHNHIVWNAGADWNGQWVPTCKVRVTANDGTTPPPPPGMAYIPPGAFQMGDSFYESGYTDNLPLHNVQVSGFFMDINLVSGALWQAVQTWGTGHGYTFANNAYWSGFSYPVQRVSWYDCVVWCNARSEKEGLTPVYYTDNAQTIVCRSGSPDITNVQVNWNANGYRLPTEAEWEKAARGGLLGQRYPWGNNIDTSDANYDSSQNGPTPCGYYNGSQTPAGVNMANGYGLYDMAGNAFEWCWDWYGSNYYGDPTANSDPRGPNSGSNRSVRSGAWNYDSGYLRCAYRCNAPPGNNYFGYYNSVIGLRCARAH